MHILQRRGNPVKKHARAKKKGPCHRGTATGPRGGKRFPGRKREKRGNYHMAKERSLLGYPPGGPGDTTTVTRWACSCKLGCRALPYAACRPVVVPFVVGGQVPGGSAESARAFLELPPAGFARQDGAGAPALFSVVAPAVFADPSPALVPSPALAISLFLLGLGGQGEARFIPAARREPSPRAAVVRSRGERLAAAARAICVGWWWVQYRLSRFGGRCGTPRRVSPSCTRRCSHISCPL